jgi:hypothetical protein
MCLPELIPSRSLDVAVNNALGVCGVQSRASRRLSRGRPAMRLPTKDTVRGQQNKPLLALRAGQPPRRRRYTSRIEKDEE